jgi:hypothetical protein
MATVNFNGGSAAAAARAKVLRAVLSICTLGFGLMLKGDSKKFRILPDGLGNQDS